MPTWLVTGASGFLGRHLLAALRERRLDEVELIAAGRRPPAERHGARFEPLDLTDPDATARVVAALKPAVVFHLAGRTPPADPAALYRENTLATLHLLDALRATGQPARVILAGSAAELGPVEADFLPVPEDHPSRPADAYGLSKWLATAAGLASRPPLVVVVGRVFNPIGPGLPTSQAFGRFAAHLGKSSQGPLMISLAPGSLDARRDFIDARDVARAFLALAERGHGGLIYHIGTGRSRSIGEGLDLLILQSGREVRIVPDEHAPPARGPSDSRADIGRIVAHTGWRPEIAWERSLSDLWQAGCH